ncbi:MAG: hypothetical protein HOV96_30425, partial [Nonomuraea sp.]|nr:hypothetical protein [Nonomuraea sp.]
GDDHEDAKKASVTIPVSGRPLDVAGLCDGAFGFTVTARGDGGGIGVEALCAGALAGRMWFTYRVGDGEEVTGTCGR